MRIVRCLGIVGLLSLSGLSLSAQIYKAPADTGRMGWGHTDYSRYLDAAFCDRVVAELSADYDRIYVPDTGVISATVPPEPTLPASVVAGARACGQRFTVDGTDPRQLLNLARVLLAAGNDAQAKAAIDRKLSLAATPDERAFILQRVITSLFQAVPARVSLTQEYFQQLVAVGAPGLQYLFAAHGQASLYWFAQYMPDSITVHAERMIAVVKMMTQEQRDHVYFVTGYDHLLDLANDAGDLDRVKQILERALADGINAWGNGFGEKWSAVADRMFQLRKSVYGKKTRPLDGTQWINHNGVPQPAPGAISLVIRLGNACGWECHQLYDMIKSLQTKHGKDLIVTLVTQTQGYLPGSGPLTPAQEVQGISDHFLKFLRLPVAVLVDVIPVTFRSDGRVEPAVSQLDERFPGGGTTNAILADREGKLQWLGAVRGSRGDRRKLDAAIDRAMRANTTPTTTHSNTQSTTLATTRSSLLEHALHTRTR